DTVHVPYRGSPPGIAALIAGEVAFMVPTLTTALPQIQGGRLRAIAVTGTTRADDLPNVPTVADTLAGYDVLSWYGIVGPANLPRPIVDRLNADLVKTLTTAEVRKALATAGMSAATSTPEQFAEYIRAEIAKYTRVARAADIQLD
ncbi:MAG: tripartite tricarboxylate transporter substrate binding protein, partial [Proteobacteria bacterium]|nr:tripartite tricarboxylate transporter substrate binding protein [Burkholderiales bacterium]